MHFWQFIVKFNLTQNCVWRRYHVTNDFFITYVYLKKTRVSLQQLLPLEIKNIFHIIYVSLIKFNLFLILHSTLVNRMKHWTTLGSLVEIEIVFMFNATANHKLYFVWLFELMCWTRFLLSIFDAQDICLRFS